MHIHIIVKVHVVIYYNEYTDYSKSMVSSHLNIVTAYHGKLAMSVIDWRYIMVIPILTYRVHGQLNLSMSIKLYFSSANSKFLLVSNYFLSLIFSITYPSRHYHSFGAEKDWLCCSAKWNVQVKQISFSILCSSHIIGWITYMDGIYVAFSIAMIYYWQALFSWSFFTIVMGLS